MALTGCAFDPSAEVCGDEMVAFAPCGTEGAAGAPTVVEVRCPVCINRGRLGGCVVEVRDDEQLTGLGFWVGTRPDNFTAKPTVRFELPGPKDARMRVPVAMPLEPGVYTVSFSALDNGSRQSTVWCGPIEVK